MLTIEDASLLYRVAKYYYLQNYSQEEIAKQEFISRPQVSRLLKKARELGIVKIDISLPDIIDKIELENKLKTILGLDKVIISPSNSDIIENDSMLYFMAAEYLSSSLAKCKKVGIGWGQSTYQISQQIPYQTEKSSTTFFPIIGNSGADNPYLQTNHICARFAERFQAKAYYNNSLVISLKKNLSSIELDRLAFLQKNWSDLDAIVLSLGGKYKPKKLFIEEFPVGTYNSGKFENLIGDVLGYFILEDGTVFQVPEEYQSIIIGLDQIKRTKNVICIAHGLPKVDIILYSVRNQLIKTLITDSNTAIALLEKLAKI
jgi:DNA-binding transcriptional regulator LsrR (DeoR family)